jgi:lysyl-tRNA synthetase class I
MDNLTPEQITQMIAMLQSMLPQQKEPVSSGDHELETIDTSPIKTKTNRRMPGNFANKFDSMMEAQLHKADTAIDKALSVYGPTPRSRKFEPVSVKCRVCGRTEEINPNLLSEAQERYKCNGCARSPG